MDRWTFLLQMFYDLQDTQADLSSISEKKHLAFLHIQGRSVQIHDLHS